MFGKSYRATGALSLDYIGKFILILIAVAIAIGLIIKLSGDAQDSIDDIGPDDGKSFPKHVEVDVISQENGVGKIVGLIETCQSVMQDELESQTCYILTKDSGSFSISADVLRNALSSSLQDSVTFQETTYDGPTIVISYDGKSRKISVEK